jgi:hypothetical protein
MNKFLLALPLVLIVGCASKPQIVEVEVPAKPSKAAEVQVQQPVWVTAPSTNAAIVTGFREVEYMQRNEVIQATKDCVDNHLKPVIQYVPQKTIHGTLMLPAMVNCEVVQGYTVPDTKSTREIVTKNVEIVVKKEPYNHEEYIRWARNQPGAQ